MHSDFGQDTQEPRQDTQEPRQDAQEPRQDTQEPSMTISLNKSPKPLSGS